MSTVALSTRTHQAQPLVAFLALTGLAAATTTRVAIGGADAAGSLPAALVFAGALALLGLVAGPARARLSRAGCGWAAIGAALLCAPAITSFDAATTREALVPWAVATTGVVLAEERLLRGALFTVLERMTGPSAAVLVTSLAFALVHVPLYGWHVVPLDLAVGMLLGSLRLATGGWGASAVAHCIADNVGWFCR